jgi:nucleoside-diphosphate-sugar epimerase
VQALVDAGTPVTALARTDSGARRLHEIGAKVLIGDIGESVRWERAAREADVIFHLGLPRLTPPLRGRHIRKLEREAAAGAQIVRDVADGRDLVMSTCAIRSSAGPLDIARPGLAAEAAMVGALGARIVRLPWAYGPSGFICDVSRGLQMRRFRIVGAGDNRLALVGARDAAAAIIAASTAPVDRYAVAEASAPTQVELVHHMCTTRGVPRPDHLPPRMATLSMGGVVVQAVTADQQVDVAPPPGFTHQQQWQTHLMEALAGG